MLFHLNLGIILLTLVSTVCSECYYRRDNVSIFHSSERNWREINKLYCANVTSEIVSVYDGQTEVEVISIRKSIIPLLPSNSSLSRFVTVRRLYMSGLGIEEIAPGAFSGLKNLNVLILATNNITTVPFGVFDELQSLRQLDLSNNQIIVLEENCFSGLTKLKSLTLSYNKLTATNAKTFKDLTSLIMLDLSVNQLTEIENYDLPALEYINARNNKIKKLTFDWSHLTHLTEIYLDECRLSEIDFAFFPKNLTILDLNSNQINSLINFDKLSAKRVDLSYNKLTRIEIYPQHVFYLCLNNNRIKTLKNSQPGENSDIHTLMLDHNETVEINSESFLGLNNLKELELQYNSIKSLNREAFQSLKSLRALNIEFIDFEEVDPNALADLPNLKFLTISRAACHSLNSSSIPSLSHLTLSGENKQLNQI